MRIALHTRVRADRIEEYEAAHRAVPAELTEAIRVGGARQWTIWRSGADLFHVIDCKDYATLLAYLNSQPVNAVWQARMVCTTAIKSIRYSTVASFSLRPIASAMASARPRLNSARAPQP